MSWMGRLDEVSIPELLHLVSWGEKTGKLVLVRYDAEGLLVFRNGKIIYAASNSPRETLGNILLCKKLISEDTLLRALEQQRRSMQERRLGAILIENGAISGKALEQVIREQIEKVMAEFLLWQSGFFRFERMDIPGSGELEMDAGDFLLQRGFNTEQLVLEVIRRVDEARKRRQEYAAATRPTVPHFPGDSALRSAEPLVPPTVSASLSTIMAEFPSRTLRGESMLAFLRQAATRVRRGVLFIPGSQGFAGSGQFGVEIPEGRVVEQVRDLVIPKDHPSILADVAAKKGPYRGLLPACFWNDYLVRHLGGQTPREAVVVPAVVDGAVVAIFYGDNLPSDAPIGPVDDLENALVEACLSRAKASPQPPATDRAPRAAGPQRSAS